MPTGKQQSLQLMKLISLTDAEPRLDQAIVCNGVGYDIGVPVIHWFDGAGFDGYTTAKATIEDRKTGAVKTIAKPRYSKRVGRLTQFVVHHSGGDGADPRGMYQTLWFERGLSVHFALEDDGRIYQFLDTQVVAWHAGAHNGCSVGVECCLFPLVGNDPHYYEPARCQRTGNLPHAQAWQTVHGQRLLAYQMPDTQVAALAALLAGTWVANGFPEAPRFPRAAAGAIPTTTIPQPLQHHGLIGHYHCTANKIDPLGVDLAALESDVFCRYDAFRACYHPLVAE